MDVLTIVIITLVTSAVAGYAASKIASKVVRKRGEKIIKEAEAEGEMIKKERILQAKEKFIQLKSEHDRAVNERNQKIAQSEQRAKQIESNLLAQQEELSKKTKEVNAAREHLDAQLQGVERRKEELDRKIKEQNVRLEQIGGLSSEEAKNILIENMKAEAKTEAMTYVNEVMEEAKMTAGKEAKKIVVQTIQRVATEAAIENSVTVFNIDSDEVKGRIIGREGRNIRALEAATGIEIIVDDTPEAIILSGFDPVRREIARLALHQLVTDGRIHPARIEEVVAKVQKQIEEEIIEAGKRTTIDLGIHGLHPELIRLIGKMKYRSSYGQNLLQHSREVANLCGIMAAELGLNAKLARRAGLLHDIGKVPDDEPELPHAIIGMKLAEKFRRPIVCFVDTSGAYCGIGAEERGQAQAIAENLYEMSALKTPILSVFIGEGGSGGALGLAVADEVWMTENAVYSVISPEGCASILWKDPAKVADAAECLKMTAADLYELGVVDRILLETGGDSVVFSTLKVLLARKLRALCAVEPDELVRARYNRFRAFGDFLTL